MTPARTAYLLDVDNTLLDNDQFEQDLRDWLHDRFAAQSDSYWHALAVRRDRLGYVDYLGAAQDCRDSAPDDPRWLVVGHYLLGYPFHQRLYPGALDLLAWLSGLGPVWLVSDGDAVMQPHKLHRAGLWQAVAGRVLIFIHKETMLGEISRNCPAGHYVLIDDKPRILLAVKAVWHSRVTTVLPRQGHYARGAAQQADGPKRAGPPPDITVDHITDLIDDPRLIDPMRLARP